MQLRESNGIWLHPREANEQPLPKGTVLSVLWLRVRLYGQSFWQRDLVT